MAERLEHYTNVGVDEVDCAATGPHCGVCEHLLFSNDWDRTPHCTKWDVDVSIRVGEVCSAFSPTSRVTPDKA